MGHWDSQFDVAHALTAHTRKCHLNAATVADDSLVLDALVFAAGTLPVAGGSENTFTEKAALFRFERTIIDRLRVLYFTGTPGADTIRRGDTDRHTVEFLTSGLIPEDFFQARVSIHRHRLMR